MSPFNRKKSSENPDGDDNSAAGGGGGGKKGGDKKKWSRRPANTAFKQQRLKAWQPILTPRTVLPTFFLIGVIFAPVGGLLLWGSNKVNEFEIDYTDCDLQTNSLAQIPSSHYSFSVSSSSSSDGGSNTAFQPPTWSFNNDTDPNSQTNIEERAVCTLQFSLTGDLKPSVFMYYKLTNYYQNHRRYVTSIDNDQLKGSAKNPGSGCDPLKNQDGKHIYPCGLIANSLFNDSFAQPILLNPQSSLTNLTYNMTDIGITWSGESDKYGTTKYRPEDVVPPPFWRARIGDTYAEGEPGSCRSCLPDLKRDEHFQVWMRTAGLPTFRKLFQKNENETMTAGRYQMEIFYNYPTRQFKGKKYIVFSTVSFIGGKNPFLGIAYIVTGGICILLGVALLLRHLVRPRRLGDLRYLSWNTPNKRDTVAAR